MVEKTPVDLIVDKLISDEVLVDAVNKLRLKVGLNELASEYVSTVLTLLTRPRDECHNFNFADSHMQVYGGVVYRKMVLDSIGDVISAHKHTYDHFTYVESGAADINGNIYISGQWAKIPKDVVHTIKALQNKSIVYCITSEHEVMKGES